MTRRAKPKDYGFSKYWTSIAFKCRNYFGNTLYRMERKGRDMILEMLEAFMYSLKQYIDTYNNLRKPWFHYFH